MSRGDNIEASSRFRGCAIDDDTNADTPEDQFPDKKIGRGSTDQTNRLSEGVHTPTQ